jgi:transcriptional regulator CtsR
VANLADIIEQHILELLARSEDLSIQRSGLASVFHCVPSQITYVLETRFTPARGFRVESRRGGGGFIRITKIDIMPGDILRVIDERIGEALDAREAEHYIMYLRDQEVLSPREASLMLAAVRNVIHKDPRVRDAIRAQVFRNMLVALAGQ